MEEAARPGIVTYEEIVTNIVRHLSITDFSVIDRMTIEEYLLLMEGTRLRKIDQLENIHLLAFKIQLAKNVKTVGGKQVPEFKTFVDFFDKKLYETGKSSKAIKVDTDDLEFYKSLAGL